MPTIEVHKVEESENVPINTRSIFIDLHKEALSNGNIEDAQVFERLANEKTTDEMRLERFNIPLPEGHPVAPRHQKIGGATLDTLK